MNEQNDEMLKETMKHYYDLFKHITTLNTGAIVILASFFTQIKSNTVNHWILNVSVIMLALSLLVCILGMYSVTTEMKSRSDGIPFAPKFNVLNRYTTPLFKLCLSSFFMGMLFLILFIMQV